MTTLPLDLTAPGLGLRPEFQELHAAWELCGEIQESQAACTKYYHRLDDVRMVLAKMHSANQLPSADTLVQYSDCLHTFMAFLRRYRGKPLYKRVLQCTKMMDELKQAHENLDALVRQVGTTTTDALTDWKREWEEDRRRQIAMFETTASNSEVILGEVRKTRELVEAMTVLKYETDRREAERGQRESEHNEQVQSILRQLLTGFVRASKSSIPVVPAWFIPPDDVQYEPMPFAQGSFGAVHHGVWGSGTQVVVMTLLVDGMELTDTARKQFLDGIDIWSRLNHRHVIKMYGASHVTAPPFIVCEDAVHGNAAQYLAASKNAATDMWKVLYEAALGLEYIHKKGVVHGDLKLNNILGEDCRARIADFGLSSVRAAATATKTKGENASGGGLRWRAPECLARRATKESDIYSLAMCMIEAATGEPPFAFADDDVVYRLLHDGKIQEQPSELSEAAWNLVKEMTTSDPAKRCDLPYVIKTLKAFVKDTDDPLDSPIEAPKPNAVRLAEATDCESLTDDCETVAALISQLDKLQTVTSVLQRDGSRLVLEAAFAVVLCSRQYHKVREALIESHVIAHCVKLMEHPKREVQINAIDALVHLAYDVSTKIAIAEAGALAPLMRRYREGEKQQKTSAASALSVLASEAPEISAAMMAIGAIDAFIWLLRPRKKRHDNVEAIMAIRTLADNDAMNKIVIAAAGAIDPLVRLLCDGSDEQKRAAAVALTSIADADRANKMAIVAAGALPPLVKLLGESNDQKVAATGALGELAIGVRKTSKQSGTDALKLLAARALSHIAYDDPSFTNLSVTLEPFVYLVEYGTPEDKEEAVGALNILVSSCAFQADIKTMRPLVSFSQHGTQQQKLSAARVLSKLEYKRAEKPAALLASGVIESLLFLVCQGTSEDQETAFKCVKGFPADTTTLRALADAGFFDVLVHLLVMGSKEMKVFALTLITSAAESGHTLQAPIIAARAAGPLVGLVRTGDQTLKTGAAMAIIALVDGNAANKSAIIAIGGVDLLHSLLRDGSKNEKATAALSLGYVAIDASTKAAVVAAGATDQIVDVISKGTKEQERLHGVQAIISLSDGILSNKTAFVAAGVINALVRLVQTGTDTEKAAATIALGTLADGGADNKVEIVAGGAIGALVDFFREANAEHKLLAGRVISRLADKMERDGRSREAIDCLVWLVQNGADADKDNVILVLGSVANGGNFGTLCTTPSVFAVLFALVRDGTDSQKIQATLQFGLLVRFNRPALVTQAARALLELVRDRRSEHKAAAFARLMKLAGVNLENAIAAIDAGAVDVLVRVFGESTGEEKILAARTICSLVRDDLKSKRAIVTGGGANALAYLLIHERYCCDKRPVLSALRTLAFDVDSKFTIVAAGAVELLLNLLRPGFSQRLTKAAVTLAVLADGVPENKRAIIAAGGVEVLVRVLHDRRESEKLMVAVALGHLAETVQSKEVAIAAGVADCIVQALSAEASELLPEGVAPEFVVRAMISLSDGIRSNKTAFVAAGGVRPLVQLVTSGSDKENAIATIALGTLADGVDANIIAIVAGGAVGPLVDFFGTATDEQKLLIARAIACIADNVVCGRKTDVVKSLVWLFQNGSSADKARTLTHFNSLIRKDPVCAKLLASVVDDLFALVQDGPTDETARATLLLDHLVRLNPPSDPAYAVKALVSILHSGSHEQQVAAIAVLHACNRK